MMFIVWMTLTFVTGATHLVTTQHAVAGHFTTGQQATGVGHATGHAVGHGHATGQHAAVVQLVHWALVVAGHAVVVAAH